MASTPDPPANIDHTKELRPRLDRLLNEVSAENGSNTPDFILGRYIVSCLNAFDSAVAERERWYGRGEPTDPPHDPGEPRT